MEHQQPQSLFRRAKPTKIEKAKIRLETARDKMHAARRKVDHLISAEKRSALARATTKAKFRIGDIIRYTADKPPMLVVAIECYSSGEPTYRGLEVCSGKLTRNMRSTGGWGNQREWRKVGDCTELRNQTSAVSSRGNALNECQQSGNSRKSISNP